MNVKGVESFERFKKAVTAGKSEPGPAAKIRIQGTTSKVNMYQFDA